MKFSTVSNRYLSYFLELLKFVKSQNNQILSKLQASDEIQSILAYYNKYHINTYQNISRELLVPLIKLSKEQVNLISEELEKAKQTIYKLHYELF